ncbi:MAG TPA: hemerythrin domain-containing protein [Jatrophihabitantaceae bacterium]
MSESAGHRLIAWNRELIAAHERLRAALRLARESLDGEPPARDLLLYCHGFCAALSGHHEREDTGLFPALAARYPALSAVLTNLQQDHRALASLLKQFDEAMRSSAPLTPHLDGLAAIMESHFQYEERQLLETLAELDLDAEPRSMLGPL